MALSAVLAILIVLAVFASAKFSISNAPAATPSEISVETVAEGLRIPWAFGFLPDGRILITEREGRVRVIDEHGDLLESNWLSPDFVGGVQEFNGLAVAPDFTDTRHVFVVVAVTSDDPTRTGGADFEHRIYRFTDRDGVAAEPVVVAERIPAGDYHGGGQLAFGPDGALYLSTGDAQQPPRAQDPYDFVGKIIRLNRDGSIPDDNPDANSPIYAIGFRNSHGFAWHPDTEDFFATEHGPTDFPGEGGRRHQDELNIVRADANYGWPAVSGMSADPLFVRPLLEWTPAIAPAGLAIIDLPGSPWDRSVFIAALRGQHLRQILLERNTRPSRETQWSVIAQNIFFQGKYGRIRAVAQAPNGFLYFASGNAIYKINLLAL